MRLRTYRFSVVFLFACWMLLAAASGFARSFGIFPKIVLVEPAAQLVGKAIRITVTNVPLQTDPKKVKVTIGGKSADLVSTEMLPSAPGYGTAVIIVVVPGTLKPVIEVIFVGDPVRYRYRGDFSILQEALPDHPASPPAPEKSPRIVSVNPEVQQMGFPITIEIADAFGRVEESRVAIGGVTSAVEPVTISESGQATINAIVPRTLSDSDPHPSIEVTFRDSRGRNIILSYLGNFAIQQEAREQGRFAAFLQRFGVIVGAIGVVLAIAVFYMRRWIKRIPIETVIGEPFLLIDIEPIDIPDPPPELISALGGGRCVAVLGRAMSVEAGLSTRASLLKTVIEKVLDPAEVPEYLKLLEAGRVDEVIDSLDSVLLTGTLATWLVRLTKEQKPRVTTAYSRLEELPVSAVVSLNFDELAPNAFRKREAPIFVPREAERCLDTLSRHEFFVFMLNGTVDSPSEILLSQKNLKDAISRNDAFRDLLSRLYYARPLLFLGMSLSDLQSFLQMIDLTAPPAQRHFALVEVNDSTWKPIAKSLKTSYGLSVMPFTPDKRDGAIAGFLRRIGSRVGSTSVSPESLTDAKIDRLELRNIGPFTKCDLDLDSRWTVILGDNGVGKSTVLRALAVCLGGRATELSAARLLRSGASLGSITLKMGERPYLTTIRRKSGGGVTIRSPSGVPLDREVVLAVGFSALRTVGWQRGKASEGTPQRPNAGDLVPLTSEEPDPRLDGVKEWIVRLDHLKNADGVSELDRKRYEDLYVKVFELFGKLATGVKLEPGSVNPNTGEITIKTSDGLVSFESLSQGTLSLLGWAGTLMQRLYETAPAGVDPLKSAAIVLVDEIDAHMHPAWQQSLVKRLSEIFENAQFIVTSHSPLVVGGLEPEQVYRFERDVDGVVRISQPEYALKGLGAAGLLTSGLFGLASHLDIETSAALNRKRQLTAKKLDKERRFSDDDLMELRALEEKTSDVDFTSSVRDPMYKRFVEAVSKAEAGAQKEADSAPIVLTPAEREKKAELAERIVRELRSKADAKSQEESPS